MDYRSRREIVAEWMLEVCVKYYCMPEVFQLAISLLDRFSTKVNMSEAKTQLYAEACIWIADKYFNDGYLGGGPTITSAELADVSDGTYHHSRFPVAEAEILEALDWTILEETPSQWMADNKVDKIPLVTKILVALLISDESYGVDQLETAREAIKLASFPIDVESTLAKRVIRISDKYSCVRKYSGK
jgi:hypothetical protein